MMTLKVFSFPMGRERQNYIFFTKVDMKYSCT